MEARFLDAINQREIEIDALRQRLRMAETAAASLGASTEELARAQQRIAELESAPAPTPPAAPELMPLEAAVASPPVHPPHANGSNGSNGSNGHLAPLRNGKPRPRRRRNKEPDDLKLIPGVDGSVEQALHLLGVTSFRQVARWKEKDIDRIARKLYQPAERIREEGWVDSAREEHTRKYGQDP
jgi:predicted flap endonuclease-1-like 5' DNA nuclease